MLTRHHLAVIRAALQYFDEEMSPNGVKAMRPYFAEPPDEELRAEDIKQLREWLAKCKLRFICCNLAATEVVHPRMSISVEEALSIAMSYTGQVATVVLLPAA
jgi:hypothetical protein